MEANEAGEDELAEEEEASELGAAEGGGAAERPPAKRSTNAEKDDDWEPGCEGEEDEVEEDGDEDDEYDIPLKKSLAPSASLPPHQAPNLLRRLAQSQAQNRPMLVRTLPIRAPMPDRPPAQALEAEKVLTKSGRVMAVRNPPHHAKLSIVATKPSSSTAVRARLCPRAHLCPLRSTKLSKLCSA